MKNCKIIAIPIILLIVIIGYTSICFAVDVEVANINLNQTEFSLNSAFVAVSIADDAGADVTKLLDELDLAGVFLVDAHLAFKVGDYNASNLLALECSTIVENIVIEASRLKLDAERIQNDILLLMFVGSGVSLALLVLLGIICWRVLKNRYFKQVLNKRSKLEGSQ